MRTVILVALMASISLAGCFTTGPSDSTPATNVTAVVTHSATSVQPVPLVPQTTDTLHLMGPPDLTPQKPVANNDIVVAIPSPVGPTSLAARNTQLAWNFTLPEDLNVLIANATLWVDVEGAVVGDPSQGATGCFWNADLHLHGSTQVGFLATACGTESLQVPNGIRALMLQFSSAQGPFAKGTTFDVLLSTSASVQPPSSQVNLLTASIAHDSQITVKGLHLKMPSLTGVLENTPGHGTA